MNGENDEDNEDNGDDEDDADGNDDDCVRMWEYENVRMWNNKIEKQIKTLKQY